MKIGKYHIVNVSLVEEKEQNINVYELQIVHISDNSLIRKMSKKNLSDKYSYIDQETYWDLLEGATTKAVVETNKTLADVLFDSLVITKNYDVPVLNFGLTEGPTETIEKHCTFKFHKKRNENH